jgi:hypothetical protein
MPCVSACGPPGDGDNLLGMEIDFTYLGGDPAYADDNPALWQVDIRRHWSGSPAESLRNPARSSPEKRETPRSESGGFGER